MPDQSSGDSYRARRARRRAAKKRRLAAMSRPRRLGRRLGIAGQLAARPGRRHHGGAPRAVLHAQRRATAGDAAAAAGWRRSSTPTAAQWPRIGAVDRTIVSIDQVPAQVRWDVVAAEDRNFYNEPGVSITGTLRAGLNDLTGGDTQGGSGITQQYVKNAYLSNSRTLGRKLKELAIAVKLAQRVPQGPDPRVLPEHRLLRARRPTASRPRRRPTSTRTSASSPPRRERCSRPCCARRRYYDPAVNPAAAKAPLALRAAGHGDDRAPHPGAGRRDELPEGRHRRRHRPEPGRPQAAHRAAGDRRAAGARHLRGRDVRARHDDPHHDRPARPGRRRRAPSGRRSAT